MANRKMTLLKIKLMHSVSSRLLKKAKNLGVFTVLFLSSSNAFALGLGSLEISSNLDQPLSGTIELRVAQGDDLETLTAVIASREDFESLGIDYPSYLKDFSILFDTATNERRLRVTSNNVIIKEPFIHFLVRVEWSGGSFLREYTALIDPPVYAAESPVSISEPKEVGTDQTYQAKPTPPTNTNNAATPISEPATVKQVPAAEENFYTDDSSSAEGSNFEYSSAPQSTDATYGPVESGESLSVIAQDLQTQFPDLSIYQIMMVLFDENTDAFIGANINGLIQGTILKIGDLNAIRSVDIAESKAFYSRQIEEWNPQLLIPSGSDALNVGQDNYNFQDDSSFGSDSAGSDEYDTQDNFQVGSSAESNDYVSSDQGGSRDGEVLALRQEITSLESSLTSSELEKIELTERISLLEGQLADMNRLAELSVENSDLALIESTLADQNDSQFDTVADNQLIIESLDDEAFSDSSIDEFLSSGSESAEDLANEANAAIDDLVASDGALGEGLVDDEEVRDDSQTIDVGDDIDSVVGEVADDSSIAVTDDQDSLSSNDVQEETLLEKAKASFFEGGLWKVLAGLGVLLVAGAGLLFLRRRRADEEFEISMLSIESNSHSVGHSESTADAATISASRTASVASEAVDVDKETSFLTVYSDSDAVVQADEVDPVAEADVYIAYGRDEQAEEVLLDGVISHPDRIDIKQKLLKLYHKRENVGGFERMAEELYSQRSALTGDLWQQICDMGKELAPSNPLFELSGDDLNTVLEADSELLLEGDEVSEVPIGSASLEEELLEDDALDFDSSGLSADGNEEQIVDHLDDSVNDIEQTLRIEDESELVVESLAEDESIQLINFDDGRSEISELDEVEIDALEFGDDIPESMDLSKSDTSSVEPAVEFLGAEGLENALSDDDDFLDFSIDESASSEDESRGEDQNSESTISEVHELSDLEIDDDYDEARTQYELAKVFVDLGDDDGARKILVELVANKENSADVLHDSKVLLDSINS